MEKRTLLAFVLSLIVLVGWALLAQKQAPLDTIKEESHQTENTSLPQPETGPYQEPLSPDIRENGISKPEPAPILEKEIKVETPLYIAIFSNRGPTIKSFKLKEYFVNQEPNSPLIELANLQDNRQDFITIHFDTQSNLKDTDSIYDVDEDAILLNPSSPAKNLTFARTRSDGISIRKTFRFQPDSYPIETQITLSNESQYQISGNIRTSIKNLPPQDKDSYYAFNGAALFLDDDLEEIKPKKMEEEKRLTGKIDWVAYENGYFISAVLPKEKNQGSFIGRLLPSGTVEASYVEPPINLRPLENASSHFMLYIGPKDVSILKQAGGKLDRAINFGYVDIIARPLHFTLLWFNKYVHNYGLSIIILTILIKILFWPLTHKSFKSMKEMQKIQPLMAKIREKHKNNREQMQRELMGLYKTYKINPMGGCLPILIQLPVFFALFRILGNSIELRHAPFMLWITDLSAPDRLFHFDISYIPFMAKPYGIPVLTLLMGASMFLQQKMTPTPGDPAQAKVMMLLPIIFTVMFINFPSGLVLYWLINNILSIGQQYRIKKRSA
ncbi:MAG: membrane protein insertase YidC [Deltaproteobacteria bacterium]|nr:membrane protein insertase YidC [Deltaproteobacteria bacterium]